MLKKHSGELPDPTLFAEPELEFGDDPACEACLRYLDECVCPPGKKKPVWDNP